MKTYVLVHGAWHGSWSWMRVAARLLAAGHAVHAVTLTGLGERSHLLHDDIDLTMHVNDVVNEILWKDLNDVVLCGHSYGGMVITGVSERVPERLASIVYVDAFLPKDGQTLNEISGNTHRPKKGALAPPSAAVFRVNEADAAWVQAKFTPQPAAAFAEPIKLTGALGRLAKRTYIRATVGGAPFIAEIFRGLQADPTWKTLEMDCGHDIMIDMPNELTETLLAC